MIWPPHDTLQLGGFLTAPKSITYLATGEKVDFDVDGHRIILKNLPKEAVDKHAGITVFKMEFEEKGQYQWVSYYPHMNFGVNVAGDLAQ